MTKQKNRLHKKQHGAYYSVSDRRMTENDLQRGLGLTTPLGVRFQENHHIHRKVACLQSGDKAQLRRAGLYPRETKPAVYIDQSGNLYDYQYAPCSRKGMGRAIMISVNEWLKAHGEVAR